jgi:hypothetical protein
MDPVGKVIAGVHIKSLAIPTGEYQDVEIEQLSVGLSKSSTLSQASFMKFTLGSGYGVLLSTFRKNHPLGKE